MGDPITTGLSVAGSLIGTSMTNSQSAANVQAANEANMQMQQDAESFNANQADIARSFNASQGDISRSFSADQAAQARSFSADQAAKQMAFQQNMSSTAYQRAVSDMRAAGLNPVLAANVGGESSPSGAMGSAVMASSPSVSGPSASAPSPPRMQAPEVQNLGDAAVRGLSSAVQAQRSLAEIDNAKAQLAVQSAQVNKLDADTQDTMEHAGVNQAVRYKLGADIKNTNADIQNKLDQNYGIRMENILRELNTHSAAATAAMGDITKDYLTGPVGRALTYGRLGGVDLSGMLSPVINSANSVSRFVP